MEERRLEGVWWLPNDPDGAVPGIMEFSNDAGIELRLLGMFNVASGTDPTAMTPPVIHGAAEGKSITLCRGLPLGFKMSGPGAVSQRFRAEYALVGANVVSPDTVQFNKATIEYAHLSDWARLTGFDDNLVVGNGSQLQEYELLYKYPEEVGADTDQARLAISYGFRRTGDLISKVSLEQTVHFRVEPREAVSFSSLLKHFVTPLRNFLTLSTVLPNYVSRLAVYSSQVQVEAAAGMRDVELEVLYQQLRGRDEEKSLSPYDMLLTLGDVSGQFGAVMQNWLNVANDLESVCSLFFGLRYAPIVYAEWEFLNLAQAAESYHRRRLSNEVLPKNHHKAKLKSIVDAAPDEHRTWLKQRLSYSNEPSFADRIAELAALTKHIIGPLVSSPEKFVKLVKDTRHYMTHHDPRGRDKAATGARLYGAALTLEFMVEACLLSELGLSEEKSKAVFARNQRYAQALSRWKGTVG